MSRPTVRDLAREAGVSLATIDRVLNARRGVRQETIDRVNAAIGRIGYVRDVSAANLARRRAHAFAVVVPAGDNPFVATLTEALNAAAIANAGERFGLDLIEVPAHDPHLVADALDRLAGHDGVAVMMPETPQARDAVARLRTRGVAVVTLVSDLPASGRDHFVGIDNRAAGRTAGVLMGRFLPDGPARVLVVANSMLSRDGIERRLGFDAVLSERFAKVHALPSLETHDDPARVAATLTRALAGAAIDGVYVMTPDLAPVLAALAAAPDRSPVVIAHELTAVAEAALREGTVAAVIAQNPGHLARSVIRVLSARAAGTRIDPAQEAIRIEIIIAENLPAQPG